MLAPGRVLRGALLNSQPMGFYAPAQIVRDARDHGVEVRPVCVNASRWDCTLEAAEEEGRLRRAAGSADGEGPRQRPCRRDCGCAGRPALRVGRGAVAPRRACRRPRWRASPRRTRSARRWGWRGARRYGRSRRCGTRRCRCLPPLDRAGETNPCRRTRAVARCGRMPAAREVVEDYGHVGLTLRRHPVAFLRADLDRRRAWSTAPRPWRPRDGRWLKAAGLVLVRQRPGSAKGVMFITIEDETGVANLVVWPKVFEEYPPHDAVGRHDRRAAAASSARARSCISSPTASRTCRRDLASVGERGAGVPADAGPRRRMA